MSVAIERPTNLKPEYAWGGALAVSQLCIGDLLQWGGRSAIGGAFNYTPSIPPTQGFLQKLNRVTFDWNTGYRDEFDGKLVVHRTRLSELVGGLVIREKTVYRIVEGAV